MCCGTRGHHGGGHHHGSSCNYGGPTHFARRFCTGEEKIACLEQYLESLQKEAQAAQEHIAKLQEK